jgi:hypothetical protein
VCRYSALRTETWRPGDTFLAASDLRRFGILTIDPGAPGVHAGHAIGIPPSFVTRDALGGR